MSAEIIFFVAKNFARTGVDDRFASDFEKLDEQNPDERNRDPDRVRDEIREFGDTDRKHAVEQFFQNADKNSVSEREDERDRLGRMFAESESRRENDRKNDERNFRVREFVRDEIEIELKNRDRREDQNGREKKIFFHFSAIEIDRKLPKSRKHFCAN